MKIQNTDNTYGLLGGVIGFIYSVIKSFTEHINGWEILQSMLCALAGYAIVRMVRHFYPESKQKNEKLP